MGCYVSRNNKVFITCDFQCGLFTLYEHLNSSHFSGTGSLLKWIFKVDKIIELMLQLGLWTQLVDFTYLSSDILNHPRQIMILCLLVFTPGHKPSSFPVVVIITQGHLGTDQYYFSEKI